jgi:hypothetical protein
MTVAFALVDITPAQKTKPANEITFRKALIIQPLATIWTPAQRLPIINNCQCVKLNAHFPTSNGKEHMRRELKQKTPGRCVVRVGKLGFEGATITRRAQPKRCGRSRSIRVVVGWLRW